MRCPSRDPKDRRRAGGQVSGTQYRGESLVIVITSAKRIPRRLKDTWRHLEAVNVHLQSTCLLDLARRVVDIANFRLLKFDCHAEEVRKLFSKQQVL